MHFIDTVPESLLKEKLIALGELYRDADLAVRNFVQTVDFECSIGCGKCCQGFLPDLLPLEAAYIASFLIARDMKSAKTIGRVGLTPLDSLASNPTCPLYLIDSPYHCSVYEARPLVCRMFGFSGVKDKHDDLSFSLCRHMDGASSTDSERKFRVMQSDPRFPVKPPAMSLYGEKLQSFDPNDSGKRGLLHEAVPAAIGRILFLISIAQTGIRIETGESE